MVGSMEAFVVEDMVEEGMAVELKEAKGVAFAVEADAAQAAEKAAVVHVVEWLEAKVDVLGSAAALVAMVEAGAMGAVMVVR